MPQFIKPYNDDPFVGNLSTPITTSSFTKLYLSNLPAYRKGLSPLLRGLEVGMAHGYFLVGPFYKLGPLRNSSSALLVGFLSAVGLICFSTAGLAIYGYVSFKEGGSPDVLQTSEGWEKFTGGFFVGAVGGAAFVYLVLRNVSYFD
jgi:photosystem I subunit 11